jgi:excisionase family DNA binding protein
MHVTPYQTMSDKAGRQVHAVTASLQQFTPTTLESYDQTSPTPDGKSQVVIGLRFFTVPEIADLLQMKRERVYEAVRLGLVPAVHIGRQIRIEERAFVEWVRNGGQTHAGGWRHQAS